MRHIEWKIDHQNFLHSLPGRRNKCSWQTQLSDNKKCEKHWQLVYLIYIYVGLVYKAIKITVVKLKSFF